MGQFRQNALFVEPKEVTLALKWQTKVKTDSDLPNHRLIPSTCQFVSIRETLRAIFSQPDFQMMYTKYNLEEKHRCERGIYFDFCCGSTFKNKEVFLDPNVIQLQIFMDDFEVCCAAKSKATKHKMCGIYFQIRNLPHNIVSKINNIFLVALVSSEDLKNDNVLNDVNELIVDELKVLETYGFQTTDGKQWKAVLVNISLDNLGANFLFGFSKGFNAHYYCRICDMHREVCEVTTRELPETLRKKQTHQENVKLMEENATCTLKESVGVRMDCLYNSLENYDIFDNVSLDIMHDLHEGIIPYFLTAFFEHCISNQIETEQNLVRKVRDFTYGQLFQVNKPSLLGLKKTHLGQNASQAYCLIVHLPFIFHYLKEKLTPIWGTLTELLQCMQIIMSIKITEVDLKRLEQHIQRFLDGLLSLTGKLIPKAHLLTHYVSAIRKVGPLKHMWTMRFECKHQFFTNAAKLTYNFNNLKKTVAYKHQEQICLKKYSIQNVIEESKQITLFRDHCDFAMYEHFLSSVHKNIEFDCLFLVPFFKFNNYTYKKGLVLIENFLVYDIICVLKWHNDYYFLCEIFENKKFENCFNSIEIEAYSPEKQLALIKHSELHNMQSFSKIVCEKKTFIIAENLTVFNSSHDSV